MFNDCAQFNQPSMVDNTGTEFSAMFSGCTMFNQPRQLEYDWCHRVQRNVQERAALNQPIGGWDVSSGSNFNKIFYGATAFSQLLTNWQVTDTLVGGVDAMFYNVVALTRTHVSASNTFSCACSANNYTSDGIPPLQQLLAAIRRDCVEDGRFHVQRRALLSTAPTRSLHSMAQLSKTDVSLVSDFSLILWIHVLQHQHQRLGCQRRHDFSRMFRAARLSISPW